MNTIKPSSWIEAKRSVCSRVNDLCQHLASHPLLDDEKNPSFTVFLYQLMYLQDSYINGSEEDGGEFGALYDHFIDIIKKRAGSYIDSEWNLQNPYHPARQKKFAELVSSVEETITLDRSDTLTYAAESVILGERRIVDFLSEIQGSVLHNIQSIFASLDLADNGEQFEESDLDTILEIIAKRINLAALLTPEASPGQKRLASMIYSVRAEISDIQKNVRDEHIRAILKPVNSRGVTSLAAYRESRKSGAQQDQM